MWMWLKSCFRLVRTAAIFTYFFFFCRIFSPSLIFTFRTRLSLFWFWVFVSFVCIFSSIEPHQFVRKWTEEIHFHVHVGAFILIQVKRTTSVTPAGSCLSETPSPDHKTRRHLRESNHCLLSSYMWPKRTNIVVELRKHVLPVCSIWTGPRRHKSVIFYCIVVFKGPQEDAMCTSAVGARHILTQTTQKAAFVRLLVVCSLANAGEAAMPLAKAKPKKSPSVSPFRKNAGQPVISHKNGEIMTL